VSPRPAVRA